MSSDKQQKLERYERKDYLETVEFPVEIVGRDGLVREYSFEDAIRLYQRRVTFAPIRYRDAELRDAEVQHCQARIKQLRRSYFVRYGWGTPEGAKDGQALFGDLAGELTAFFQRVFGDSGRSEVLFEALGQTDEVSNWYVTRRAENAAVLLYVYAFGKGQEEMQRERFFSALKQLENSGQSGEADETLVAFHHTSDCGFIITDRTGIYLDAKENAATARVSNEPSEWDNLVDMVRRGQYEQSLVLCHDMVRAQPWDRKAYMMGALLASFLGYELTSEELASLGSMYFKEQAELHYWIGLARYRQGRIEESAESFGESVNRDPSLIAAQYYLAIALVKRGQYGLAYDHCGSSLSIRTDDRRGQVLLQRMAQWIRWRRWMVAGGILSQVVGVAVAVFLGWVGLIPISMGIAVTWGGIQTFQLQTQRIMDLQRFDDISYWIRRINRQQVAPDQMS